MGAEQAGIGGEGLSSEKTSMYEVAGIHPVSMQSGHSMFLVKDDLHGGNGSLLVEGCCGGGIVCWKGSLESLSEDLAQARKRGVHLI